MGRDYQPKIIFGLKIPHSEIYEKYEDPKNNCKCTPQRAQGMGLIPLTAKYCPDCGSSLAYPVKKERCILDLFGEYDQYAWEVQTIAGYKVDYDIDGHNIYIGFYSERGEYGHYGTRKIDFPDMSQEQKFINDMHELGLWDKGEYGAWLVLYLSY